MITLNAEPRDVKVNPKMIRRDAKIPAVFYGPGHPSTPITIDKMEFSKTLKAAGESTVITLKTPQAALEVLIHDVELHPVIGDPIHVDFYVVAKGHKVQVNVPVEFIGVAPAEKLGGIVVKVVHELHVEALPAKLPAHLTVDLSKLTELTSHITVADIVLEKDVRITAPADEIIASVTLPKEEKEAPALDMSAIEVQKKGKKEEEKIAE